MATGDLTTLERVRDHLGMSETSDADTILDRLITSSTAWALGEMDREVLSTTYTETVDGDGTQRVLLYNYPVVSVTSVVVDDETIPERTVVGGDGWILRDQGIDLVGYTFTEGKSNVVLTYRAGYQDSLSTTIPASPGPYTVDAGDTWRGDVSVTIAGVAATKTTGTISAGKYQISDGTYTFHSGDAEKAVVITFQVCPTDLEEAIIEHVALRYRDRGREGLAMSSGGGEAITMVAAGGTLAYINGVLEGYRRMVSR